MRFDMKPSKFVFPAAALIFCATAMAASGAMPATPTTPPAGAGFDLIKDRCGFCHTTEQVFLARKAPADWATTVQAMIDRGAELSPDEQKTVVSYLSTNFAAGDQAPSTAPATSATPAAAKP
jgi:hypothetical protein